VRPKDCIRTANPLSWTVQVMVGFP
jgi:hypothetical protein